MVLFLISYSLMVALIVEQGQTIESQRVLIRELFRDSEELSAARKAQAAQIQTQETQIAIPGSSTQIQAPAASTQSSSTPSTQVHKAPSTQAKSNLKQQNAQTRAPKTKSDFQMPSRPASDLADSDRSVKTI